MKSIAVCLSTLLLAVSAHAALPAAPAMDDAAKAKAAEAAAKKAHAGKVDAYKACKAQDKAVVNYRRTAKNAMPAIATPPCANPGKM